MTENKSTLKLEKIKIYGLPKGSVMWPSALGSLILGIIGNLNSDLPVSLTMIFLIIFSINLLILFFDFSRGAVVGLTGLVFGVLGVLYGLDISVSFTDYLDNGVVEGAPSEFFVFYGSIFLVLLFFAIIFRRSFEYFELNSNELVKKHGILGDSQRYNAPNLQIKKHINDVFESLLLFGSGDLVLITSDGQEFHINNVIRINRLEKNIRKLLSRLDVEISTD